MKCVKCGNALEAGARFCGACGTQQPGAVIPQAAVRTGAKTLFQGSAQRAGGQGAGVAKPAAPEAVPEKRGPVSSAMSFAATIAPGSAEMKAIAPPAASPQPAGRGRAGPRPPSRRDAAAVAARAAGRRPRSDRQAAQQPLPRRGQARRGRLRRRLPRDADADEPQGGAQGPARQDGQGSAGGRPLQARGAGVVAVAGAAHGAGLRLRSVARRAHVPGDGDPAGPLAARDPGAGRPAAAGAAVGVMDGIAESLGEAHGHGIVHRDIKPENIYLEPRPTPDFVKVLDFGIAKIVSGEGLGGSAGPALTAAGQTLGTLEYMSPEQLMGAQLDGRSDLYALGILAYELVTGALPFVCKTPGEMITAHLKTMPPPPSQAAPGRGIPPLLDQVILQAAGQEARRSLSRHRASCAADLRAPACEARPARRRRAPARRWWWRRRSRRAMRHRPIACRRWRRRARRRSRSRRSAAARSSSSPAWCSPSPPPSSWSCCWSCGSADPIRSRR